MSTRITLRGGALHTAVRAMVMLALCLLSLTLRVPAAASELVAVSEVVVDASKRLEPLAHFGAKHTNNAGGLGGEDAAALAEAFDFETYRVWINVDWYYNFGTGTYNFGYYYGTLDRISKLSRYLLLNVGVRTRPGLDHMLQAIEEGTFSFEEFKEVLIAGLMHYKQRYPNILYIEAMNEYDLLSSNRGLKVPYYEYYKVFYEAVNYVNEKLQPEIPLLLGGPVSWRLYGNNLRTLHWPNGNNLVEEFLDAYAKDPNPSKRLDFIAYHEYLNRRGFEPSLIDKQKEAIEGELLRRGLDPNIPIFVTEVGVLPSDYGTQDYHSDLLLQAAGVATLMYRYAEQGIVSFHWVDHHPENDRKDILVPGHPGKFTPYGNMMRMQTMLKEERVYASTDGQTPEGLGIYALGTVDDSGVAVMVWNYDWPDYTWSDGTRYTSTGKVHETTVRVLNLPKAFQAQNVRVEEYLIDSTHSHYGHDLSRSGLEKVRDVVLPGDEDFTTQIVLEKNALALLVLTPTDESLRPGVRLRVPGSGAAVYGDICVHIDVDTVPGVTIDKVSLSVGDTVVHEAQVHEDCLVLDTRTLQDGRHPLQAGVVYNGGRTVTSEVVWLEVENEWNLVDALPAPLRVGWFGGDAAIAATKFTDSSAGWQYVGDAPARYGEDRDRMRVQSANRTEFLVWPAPDLQRYEVVVYVEDLAELNRLHFEVLRGGVWQALAPPTLDVDDDRADGVYKVVVRGSVDFTGADELRLLVRPFETGTNTLQLGEVRLVGLKR